MSYARIYAWVQKPEFCAMWEGSLDEVAIAPLNYPLFVRMQELAQ
jgi:hypothetical protein